MNMFPQPANPMMQGGADGGQQPPNPETQAQIALRGLMRANRQQNGGDGVGQTSNPAATGEGLP